MNAVDPRHQLHANCAEHVSDSWYINNYAPITSWSKEIIYRSFDLTIDEFLDAEAKLFEANCGLWAEDQKSYGVDIPGWWKRGWLDGGISKVQRYIRENPEDLIEDTPAKKKNHSTIPAKKRRTNLKDLRRYYLYTFRGDTNRKYADQSHGVWRRYGSWLGYVSCFTVIHKVRGHTY
ncbi:hypothetical protein N431DRAFT_530165 [Stipitochalara longipes BDJ]|nr:hypothetical protein N431DRAFT_530165 [Stipitochalara longipes BDJ]